MSWAGSSRPLVVASGKGGTGKTTVAVALAMSMPGPVHLLDCDVEEPNAHLFIAGAVQERRPVSIPIPTFALEVCDGCGLCAEVCAYNAIALARRAPMVFDDLCHGCGGCTQLCPVGAIRETDLRIGEVITRRSGDVLLTSGELDVGRAVAGPVIREVRRTATSDRPVIIDAPPGTACPTIAALRGGGFALLVTEPTPFGLHDLRLAVEAARSLGVPTGVVVNRAREGWDGVQEYCATQRIPVLAEIPEDRRIAEAYSSGRVILDAAPGLVETFAALADAVRTRAEGILS